MVIAKVVVLAGAGLTVTVAAEAVMLGLTYGLSQGRGVAPAFGAADATALAGLAAAGALWGAIGVGVGGAVRHQLAAVLVPVVWVMFVEDSLLAGPWPRLASYLPAKAGMNLAFATTWRAAWVAGAVLAAYALAFWAAGAALSQRRDIA